jgi:non-ribosomal peptide synthetase component F
LRNLFLLSSFFFFLNQKGNAYVPLDPKYPINRLRYMSNDSELTIILTENQYVDSEWKNICLICSLEKLSSNSTTATTTTTTSTNENNGAGVAYVLYTSGSTGKPKGVCGK